MRNDLNHLIEKAAGLIEALPYIKKFNNKTFVIKYGGSAMASEELKMGFALDIVLLKYIGINPVVVHGGGPQIGKTLSKMGKKSKFIEGMRVTDEETIDIVEMVLVGKVNKDIVAMINKQGGRAVGLSGKDADLIKAKKIKIERFSPETNQPEIIDIGRVGKVVSIQTDILTTLDENDFIPIIAPVGVGKNGDAYNINADFVAAEIAKELKAEKLLLLTDTEGIKDESDKLLKTQNQQEVDLLIQQGIIAGGMLPKVKCCIDALHGGVNKVHIIDGRLKHAILLEIFTKEGVGTEIIP